MPKHAFEIISVSLKFILMLFKQQSCGSILHNYVCINVLRANTAFLLLVLPYKYTPLQEKFPPNNATLVPWAELQIQQIMFLLLMQ